MSASHLLYKKDNGLITLITALAMNRLYLTLLLLALLYHFAEPGQLFHSIRPIGINTETESDSENHPRIWALLVAGSNEWYNYRHQADVCHAYHILRHHGIPKENIITMMYDDIAMNEENPYPGKIFNRPHGPDVYHGVKIDYKNEDVTPSNFLAILQGNASAVKGGNGRVIKSNAHDHIFVYFTDHGSTGSIAFPDDILTAHDLNVVLKKIYQRRHYNQLVFYLEACESGSMFQNILPKNISVYAMTAANSDESSWGYYCDNDMDLPCLGDHFSINWMRDSNAKQYCKETLQGQYEIVKENTNMSHVMQYGDLSIANEFMVDFQGWRNGNEQFAAPEYEKGEAIAWPSRDIPLLMLQKQHRTEKGMHQKFQLRRQIHKIERGREFLHNFMKELVEKIIHDPVKQQTTLNVHPETINDFQCHDKLLKAFHKHCFNFAKNPYALKYAFVFANICDEKIDTNLITDIIQRHCKDIRISGIL